MLLDGMPIVCGEKETWNDPTGSTFSKGRSDKRVGHRRVPDMAPRRTQGLLQKLSCILLGVLWCRSVPRLAKYLVMSSEASHSDLVEVYHPDTAASAITKTSDHNHQDRSLHPPLPSVDAGSERHLHDHAC
jgi:hypothetical protein